MAALNNFGGFQSKSQLVQFKTPQKQALPASTKSFATNYAKKSSQVDLEIGSSLI